MRNLGGAEGVIHQTSSLQPGKIKVTISTFQTLPVQTGEHEKKVHGTGDPLTNTPKVDLFQWVISLNVPLLQSEPVVHVPTFPSVAGFSRSLRISVEVADRKPPADIILP